MARSDPFGGFRFRVELGDIRVAAFREVSGLDAGTDAVDYREGTDDTIMRKLPGLQKFSNITLKHGITDNMELWNWRHNVMTGDVADPRKNIGIVLINHQNKDAARWNITNAWPTKYTGPAFNATSNEVAIDTLEITHEGLERVTVPKD